MNGIVGLLLHLFFFFMITLNNILEIQGIGLHQKKLLNYLAVPLVLFPVSIF